MTDEELKELFARNEAKIDAKIDGIDAKIDGLAEELRDEMRTQAEELRGEMRLQGEQLRTELRVEMRGQANDLREVRAQVSALRGEMHAQGVELRRHFDVVVERFDARYGLLAEGIINLNEKMDRNDAAIREEMRQGFADTHDLIRFALNLPRANP